MTRHQKLNSLIAGIALVMLIALAVVLDHGMGGKTQGGLLARLRKQGFVRVRYADEAPFAYVNPKTGKLTGESPAVLRVVMAKLGIKHLKGVLTNFGSLIPGLEAHRFDIIAAGMYITPARAREVLFSNPTFALGDGFVVRKGNPLDLHTFADAASSAGSARFSGFSALDWPARAYIELFRGTSAMAVVEAKLQQKNEVLAELMGEHVALKKKLSLI